MPFIYYIAPTLIYWNLKSFQEIRSELSGFVPCHKMCVVTIFLKSLSKFIWAIRWNRIRVQYFTRVLIRTYSFFFREMDRRKHKSVSLSVIKFEVLISKVKSMINKHLHSRYMYRWPILIRKSRYNMVRGDLSFIESYFISLIWGLYQNI